MTSKVAGYTYALLAISIFAAQDGFTRSLGEHNSPVMITVVRFWVFAGFVTSIAAVSRGGLRTALKTKHPVLQVIRGLLLVGTSGVCVLAFKFAGLAMSQAILQSTPLMVTLLSVPLLGEVVGWRRATAVIFGLVGVLIILNPGDMWIDSSLFFPIVAVFTYAFYGVATRAVSRDDGIEVSALYAGVIGAFAASVPGLLYWEPIRPEDWVPMAALCVCGTLGHYLLIRAYAVLQAVDVQPITYLQLPMSVGVATFFFDETITWNVTVGAVLIVCSGIFTVWREHASRTDTRSVANTGRLAKARRNRKLRI